MSTRDLRVTKLYVHFCLLLTFLQIMIKQCMFYVLVAYNERRLNWLFQDATKCYVHNFTVLFIVTVFFVVSQSQSDVGVTCARHRTAVQSLSDSVTVFHVLTNRTPQLCHVIWT